MPKPLIGITTYNGTSVAGLPIVAVQHNYINAIRAAGGIPLLLPNQLVEGEWWEAYRHLNGILFTGGGDIRTDLFNGSPHPKVGEVDDERDSLELPMMRLAVKEGKPFMGICRGCQVMNVALGGTLYTHIPDQLEGAVRHDWNPYIPRNHLAHPVQIAEDSRIGEIMGEPMLRVNSLHHQGIKDLAPALKAVGFAPDGLIEAAELPDHPFGLAVQWHPEWLTDQEPTRRLFHAFVESARKT